MRSLQSILKTEPACFICAAWFIHATKTRLCLLLVLIVLTTSAGCGTEETALAAGQEKAGDEASQEETVYVELELGKFRFRTSDPTAGTTTKYNITLVGLLEQGKEEELAALLKEREIRFRDRVLITARESTLAEIEDPELKMFSRRLLRELNETLETDLIKEILFAKYWVKTR